LDHSFLKDYRDEVHVLFPSGHQFGSDQIVDVKTPTGGIIGIGIVNRNQPLAPAIWKRSGVFTNAVGVIAVSLVKRGVLADVAVNLDG
jgi:hypothetical protein